MPDVEAGALLHRRFLHFHSADVRIARAFPEHAREVRKLLVASDRVDFDVAIIQVPDVSANPYSVRGMLGEVTKPDALYAAAHDVPPRYFLLAQWAFNSG